MKPWPLQITLTKTKNDGHVPIVGLRTTSLRTTLTCPLVIAHNTLSHVTSEYLELRCVAILTMDIAQERHVLYIYNTFACHARAPTPESPVWTKKTEDWSTGTSDTRSVPRHLLTIEHDQVYHRPSLSSKHTLPDLCTTTFSAALSYLYPSIEAHKQMHSQHTEISTHTCMPSTDAHQQIHSLYTEANTQASMPSSGVSTVGPSGARAPLNFSLFNVIIK